MAVGNCQVKSVSDFHPWWAVMEAVRREVCFINTLLITAVKIYCSGALRNTICMFLCWATEKTAIEPYWHKMAPRKLGLEWKRWVISKCHFPTLVFSALAHNVFVRLALKSEECIKQR